MYNYHKTANKPIKAWTGNMPVEERAMQQLHNTANLPIIYKHLAVMPDVHFGYGATIGSVVPTQKAIIPAAVGVDIGCGMCAVQTSLKASDLPDSLMNIRAGIESLIPVGFSAYNTYTAAAKVTWDHQFEYGFQSLTHFYPKTIGKTHPIYQLGTLGGGNHFIELCLDENQNVWVMLHSGSRGIGNRIGNQFIANAKQEMEKYSIFLKDKNLSYLVEGTPLFNDYVYYVDWAQNYAKSNRNFMLSTLLTYLATQFKTFKIMNKVIDCHHNYVEKEHHFGHNVWITRKGAVRAREGDLGIIPGSMGARSFIVQGKGNDDSFHSCSHGAGRVMSRTQAKKTFTLSDHETATKGVECRKDEGVIDETPAAYKDIDEVMACQTDLVEIVHTLKQVLCVKG